MHDVFKGGDPQDEQKRRIDYVRFDLSRFVREGIKEILSDDLPTSLKGIITRCLQPKIEDRFYDISELKEELLKVYKNELKNGYEFPQLEKDDSYVWWFDRGLAFYSLGRSVSAEGSWKEALGRLRAISGTEIVQARCLMNLGTVYISTGQFSQAEAHYKDALSMFRAIPGTELDQASCLTNLGTVYIRTGQFSQAEAHYKDALSMFRAIPGTEISQASCLANLGILYQETHRGGEARQVVLEALKLCELYPAGTGQIREACLKILEEVGSEKSKVRGKK